MYICTHTHSWTSLASLSLYWWIWKALWQIQTAAFFINHFSGSRRNVLSVLTRVLRGLCSSSCITHPSFQLCSSCVYHTVPSPAAPRSAGHQMLVDVAHHIADLILRYGKKRLFSLKEKRAIAIQRCLCILAAAVLHLP